LLKLSNNFEEAILDKQGISKKRKSKICWIDNRDLYTLLLEMVNSVNVSTNWNFNITGVEPVQYGIYEPDGKYDWHVDQYANPINGNVRKILFPLRLHRRLRYSLNSLCIAHFLLFLLDERECGLP